MLGSGWHANALVNPLTIRAERLERLRTICLALPKAAEKEAWGDPTWRVRDRIFAMQKGNFEGGRPSLWLKAAEDAQGLLVEADPQRFFVPPYVGHKGWVGVYLDTSRVNWSVLADLIRESYELVAPKRLATKHLAIEPTATKRQAGKRAAKKLPGGERSNVSPRAARAAPGTSLKRELHPIPSFVRKALTERGLTAAYRRRPPYQRNDYIGWITGAKRDATQRKRLAQMLAELEGGRLYMNMAWQPPGRTGSAGPAA
jgi:predicted DNA-binding protein (MmcQ/YjbR family)